MITIQALNNLQQAAPETSIVSLHTAFSDFCSIGIEPPEAVTEYFREFLSKARELTAGSECRIQHMRNGELRINLILPDRIYPITPDVSKPVYKIVEANQRSSKHQVIIRDQQGHERLATIGESTKSLQEECKAEPQPP